MRNYNEAEIEEEQIFFFNVIETFRQYTSYSLAANNRRRKDLYTLPLEDQELLDGLGYKQKLVEVDKAILANAEFLNEIIRDPEIFGHSVQEGYKQEDTDNAEGVSGGNYRAASSHDSHSHSRGGPQHTHSHPHDNPSGPSPSSQVTSQTRKKKRYRATDSDMDKLRSTLKQFVRDWSEEGKEERDACYKPIQEALLQHFSNIDPENRLNVRVLVPGAGLGRLAWDIAKLGFTCQANEFSHHMLLSSHFILNRSSEIGKHKIYPYIHSFSNLHDKSSLLRPVSIPDVSPSSLPSNSNFSMVAGDFEEIFGSDDAEESNAEQWDAILTCFFIDTAKNIVNYLRILHRILAPGGVWINLGPLLWHFENNTTNDPSIELDLEEVKELAKKIGFEISNERTINTTYVSNKESMLGYAYQAAFWCATKRVEL